MSLSMKEVFILVAYLLHRALLLSPHFRTPNVSA
jgi:hypothetical protein